MKIHGIKRAVGDFNRWIGHAQIMYDISDGMVWTDISSSCDEFRMYASESIVRVASKGNIAMKTNWNKITMKELEDRIRSCQVTGHAWY